MTTYGPFTLTLSSEPYQGGGSPWTIDGNSASTSISGEGTTEYLVAYGFAIEGVPDVPLSARLELSPAPQLSGLNISDALIGGQDADGWPTGARYEGLTLAQVSDPSFTAKVALYAQSGGNPNVTVALYLDEE